MINFQNVGTPARVGQHPYDLGVFIGRFQPFHLGHLHIIETALASADCLAILVGSADEPRSYFNPFFFEERAMVIMSSLPENLRDRVIILPLLDWTYNNPKWILGVQTAVGIAQDHFGLNASAKIALVGHSKDASSFYLKMFPQYDSVEIENFGNLSATPIRETFFNQSSLFKKPKDLFGGMLPEPTQGFLADFSSSVAYFDMIKEYEYIRNYKKQFEGLAYPPIFQTVDACIVQGGHILLVKRRSYPGKGLWALPGGFLNADETLDVAVYRELREETKIRVPEPVLRGSTVERRRFDDPHRSARGRTITEAFYIVLKDDTELPKVKGSDDAEKARWVPLAELKRNMMFEDHYKIISYFTGAF